MDLPKRKQIRLQSYDYSTPGAYFVTICTHDRRCLLSEIAEGGFTQLRIQIPETHAYDTSKYDLIV